MAREIDPDISYEIRAMVGTIGMKKNGWRKELNIVSWNGAPPKFDIRDWSPDHMHMSKGVTLYMDEIRQLVRVFNNFSNDRRTRNPRNETNLRAADEAFEAVPDRASSDRPASDRPAQDRSAPEQSASDWSATDSGTGAAAEHDAEEAADSEIPESDYSSSGISHVAEAGPAENDADLPF